MFHPPTINKSEWTWKPLGEVWVEFLLQSTLQVSLELWSLLNQGLDSVVQFLESGLVVVELAEVESGDAEVCECDLVTCDESLSMALKSVFKKVSHLLPGIAPFLVAFFGSLWCESIAGDCSEDRVILAEVEE